MTTLAIIGAGPGLGAAVARRFGREGFDVALISRSQEHLDALVDELSQDGVHACGFAADVRDHQALTAALDAATSALGPIEVLQYSPVPHKLGWRVARAVVTARKSAWVPPASDVDMTLA
ncbi:SDR family NAD(P)-dependent oxidoreductase, partial [Streptomyces sp. NPDC046900]|uniref:SDR family NAD(P)-dependent oxidoreductase n=1 Tax=Streptomyces sp. NPDC046900 TaxID=3155473 RepID=UPI0033CA9BC0